MWKRWAGKKPQETPAEPASEDSQRVVPPAGGPEETAAPAAEKRSTWGLLKRGLSKTRRGLRALFSLRRPLDDDFVDELEAVLYRADFGPETVERLINGEDGIRQAWKVKKISRVEEVREYLKGRLKESLLKRDGRLLVAGEKPTVILVAGVNGTGKTTTIAKLAKKLKDQGHSVLLAAADTFRAAAVEQLTVWSERLGVEIVKGDSGADPGSVAYRAVDEAVRRGLDFLIVDTAGRLHTQKNLMRELTKIRSVLAKKVPGAPHEALLVLDATTGQNAINQARSFLEAIQITGIALAKLDGTAKGGIVVTINNLLEIPVKYVGVGESLDDLEEFDAEGFVEALLEGERDP